MRVRQRDVGERTEGCTEQSPANPKTSSKGTPALCAMQGRAELPMNIYLGRRGTEADVYIYTFSHIHFLPEKGPADVYYRRSP